jgi:hypothetical protein
MGVGYGSSLLVFELNLHSSQCLVFGSMGGMRELIHMIVKSKGVIRSKLWIDAYYTRIC